MGINEAVEVIERFLLEYRDPKVWNPREIRVLPSGDERNHIKVWLNFGPGVTGDELADLERQVMEPLIDAHPRLSAFILEIRSESLP